MSLDDAGRGQLLYRHVRRFRGRLVFKAHKLLYHSTLGLRVIKKKKEDLRGFDFAASTSSLSCRGFRDWGLGFRV